MAERHKAEAALDTLDLTYTAVAGCMSLDGAKHFNRVRESLVKAVDREQRKAAAAEKLRKRRSRHER